MVQGVQQFALCNMGLFMSNSIVNYNWCHVFFHPGTQLHLPHLSATAPIQPNFYLQWIGLNQQQPFICYGVVPV